MPIEPQYRQADKSENSADGASPGVYGAPTEAQPTVTDRPKDLMMWATLNVTAPLVVSVVVAIFACFVKKDFGDGFQTAFWRGDLLLFSALLILGVLTRVRSDDATQSLAAKDKIEADRDYVRGLIAVAVTFILYLIVKGFTFTLDPSGPYRIPCATVSFLYPAYAVSYCLDLWFRHHRRTLELHAPIVEQVRQRRI